MIALGKLGSFISNHSLFSAVSNCNVIASGYQKCPIEYTPITQGVIMFWDNRAIIH